MNNAQLVQAALDGSNKVQSIDRVGVNPNGKRVGNLLITEPLQQQAVTAAEYVNSLPKGQNLIIGVTNNGIATQKFLLFDVCGAAAGNGADANGADIEITTTFAGNGGYPALKEFVKGSHMVAVGASFEWSEAGIINQTNMRVWFGDIENYNNQTLKAYIQKAKDTYANDQKILNMRSIFYLNGLFALSGQLPAGKSVELLFNIPLFRNF